MTRPMSSRYVPARGPVVEVTGDALPLVLKLLEDYLRLALDAQPWASPADAFAVAALRSDLRAAVDAAGLQPLVSRRVSQRDEMAGAAAPSVSDDHYTAHQAAEVLGVTVRRVQQLAEHLEAQRHGRRLLFPRLSVEALRDQREARANAVRHR